MATYIPIFEGDVKTERGGLLYQAHIEVEDDRPEFTVHQTGRSAIPALNFELHQKFRIENPIIEGALALAAAKAYGICIGWKLLRFTRGKARELYKAHKQAIQDCSTRERLMDVVRELSRRNEEFKEALQQAAVDCIPFSDLMGGDGDDDS
jgi:hypothetical protein